MISDPYIINLITCKMKNLVYLSILALLLKTIVMPWVSRQKALSEEELQIGT